MRRYRSRGYSAQRAIRRQEKKSRNRFFITVLLAIFFLYVIFVWVLPFLIGGLSFLNKFKPSPSAPQPVSENPTLAPPVLNIPYEATSTAQIQVKGYAQADTKVEIYKDNSLKSTITAKEDGSFISDPIPLTLGTNSFYGKTTDDKGNKSLPSKTITITYSSEKPNLTVQNPSDNQTISGDKKLTVSGHVDSPSNLTVTATVNGSQVIISSDGNFSQVVDIQDGDNNIVITATDQAGNSTQISRKVTYRP